MNFRNIEPSKIHRLEDAIEHKQNQVLSLNLCNHSDIKIVLFSLDQKEAITEEQTPDFEQFNLLQGELELSLDGEKSTSTQARALS